MGGGLYGMGAFRRESRIFVREAHATAPERPAVPVLRDADDYPPPHPRNGRLFRAPRDEPAPSGRPAAARAPARRGVVRRARGGVHLLSRRRDRQGGSGP